MCVSRGFPALPLPAPPAAARVCQCLVALRKTGGIRWVFPWKRAWEGVGIRPCRGGRMKIPPARRLPGCRRIHGSILQARTAAGGTAGQGPGACREPRARILGELEFPWERCPEGVLAFFLAHCIEEVYLMTGSGSRFRSLRNPGRDGPPRIAALGGHKPGERCLFQLRFSRVLCKRRRQNCGSVGFVLPVGNRAVRAFPPAFFPQFSQFIPAEINHAPKSCRGLSFLSPPLQSLGLPRKEEQLGWSEIPDFNLG